MAVDKRWRLSSDICRCHDADCPKSGKCARFLCRNDVGMLCHTTSLMDEQTGTCRVFIEVPEKTEK